ncbi:hypothetical protein [Virgibacillus profundi]|uniref:hypothetical protein n=1 Tax=Virgibacillus profundi TaxID=2024555 RepID=UPI0013FE3A3A|nr:hypothetical protein [Virgibacillus profundi]
MIYRMFGNMNAIKFIFIAVIIVVSIGTLLFYWVINNELSISDDNIEISGPNG